MLVHRTDTIAQHCSSNSIQDHCTNHPSGKKLAALTQDSPCQRLLLFFLRSALHILAPLLPPILGPIAPNLAEKGGRAQGI